MRIRWTPAAAADLQHLSDYLKDHHPHYRQPTLRRVYAAIQSLKEWPHRTRGRNPRDIVPSVALYRRVSREGAEHRSLTDSSRCSGPALGRCHKYLCAVSLTDQRFLASKQWNVTVLFSRGFLSFSTPRPRETRRWTSLLAYTGTVNSFPRNGGWRNPPPVTESVDKSSAPARIRKVFSR